MGHFVPAILKGVLSKFGCEVVSFVKKKFPGYVDKYADLKKYMDDKEMRRISDTIVGVSDWILKTYTPRKKSLALKPEEEQNVIRQELRGLLANEEKTIVTELMARLKDQHFLGIYVTAANVHLMILSELVTLDFEPSSYQDTLNNCIEEYVLHVEEHFECIVTNSKTKVEKFESNAICKFVKRFFPKDRETTLYNLFDRRLSLSDEYKTFLDGEDLSVFKSTDLYKKLCTKYNNPLQESSKWIALSNVPVTVVKESDIEVKFLIILDPLPTNIDLLRFQDCGMIFNV